MLRWREQILPGSEYPMRSLKSLLFLRYAVVVTLVVLIVALILILPLRSMVLNERAELLKIEATNLASIMARYFQEGRTTEIEALLAAVPSDDERLTVVDGEGGVLGDSWADPSGMENHANRPSIKEALGGEVTVSIRRSSTVNRDLIYASAPIEVGGDVVGVVRVSVEQGSITGAVVTIWLVMVAGLLVLLLVLLAVTLWTQRTLSSDLGEIGTGLEKIIVDNDLDNMPKPHLKEVYTLAQDVETIANRARENYQALARERDRLEAILDNTRTGILVLDAEGRIALLNPAAVEILGVEEEYALGRMLIEAHPSTALDRAVTRSLRGEAVKEEVDISIPSERVIRLVVSPIRDNEGEIAGVVCVLDDVSSTRWLERVRKDFVANVSHELRTPVASLRATIEAMVEGAADDDAVRARFLENLDTESARLVEVLNDLLALSRVESEKFEISRESFDLNRLLSEIIDEESDVAGKHGVNIIFEGAGESLYMEGEKKLVKTACSNLVENAIKYNRPGGRVEVAARRREGTVEVIVSDSGLGIPAEDMERIFERFYRVDRARSRETGGTGLGLSIVKHVAEIHSGDVSVTSREGQGSTFVLAFPAD